MGGMSISQQRKAVSADRMVSGGVKGKTIVAAGCGMVPPNKRKRTQLFV